MQRKKVKYVLTWENVRDAIKCDYRTEYKVCSYRSGVPNLSPVAILGQVILL